jgi:nicotinamide-nucleotide amidase
MPPATAGILSTGTEILQGLYPDTNAQWLAGRLTAAGITVRRVMAAPDEADAVADALRFLSDRCDLVIMTGGLGPTEDDLTRQAVCQVFGSQLAEDARAWEMILERFTRRGTPPPASNRVQCMIPKGARTLYNLWGTAPGFVIEAATTGASRSVAVDGADQNGAVEGPRHSASPTWFVALPGPPRECRPMFEQYLEAEIAQRFGGGVASRILTLHTYGVSESALNDLLHPLFADLRGDPWRTLAFLAGEARVDIRLTVRGQGAAEMRKRLAPLVARIRRRVPADCFYGTDDETLEAVAGRALAQRGLTLATAESCTGGLVAKRLTDVPGSSDYLREGWVTYSNEAKQHRLGVAAATLRRHGAVSEETAREMALGALRESGADVAVSVTGIAGPAGGTGEKPVGLVWYGLAWRERRLRGIAAADDALGLGVTRVGALRVAATQTNFRSTRDLVRIYASHRALDLVRRLALGLPLCLPR